MLMLNGISWQHFFIPIRIRIIIRICTISEFYQFIFLVYLLPHECIIQTCIVIRIGKFRQLCRRLYRDIPWIFNARFILLSPLSSYNHYTISATHTKDCCRSRIFQHINGLNIIRVHTCKICRRAFYPINDKCRRCISPESCNTTYIQRSIICSRLALSLFRDKPRNLPYQCISRISRLSLQQFITFYRSYSTGQIGFFLNAVAHHHHFIQRFSIFQKNDFKCSLPFHQNILRFKTYISHWKNCIRRNRQGEVTIYISDCSYRSISFHHYIYSGQWFHVRTTYHQALYLNSLSIYSPQGKYKQK